MPLASIVTSGPVNVERMFPLGIVHALCLDDEILDGRARVGLLGDHDAAGEEEAVERHRLEAEALH